jgi:uncharacterized protein
MIRAVLDTNVVVSAALTAAGPSAQILKAGFAGYFNWFTSQELLDEYHEVLNRPYLELDRKEVLRVLELIKQTATLVIPSERFSLASDPDDDKVIECAVEAHAHYIVTGNLRHFPERVRDIITLGPRAFLEVLSRSA